MPHTFRTIEEFVQLLEGWKQNAERSRGSYKEYQQGWSYMNARALALQDVLQILRNSNIGIVYPKLAPIEYRQSGAGFWECDVCASKPGSPTLCPACLHNRAVISHLQNNGGKL